MFKNIVKTVGATIADAFGLSLENPSTSLADESAIDELWDGPGSNFAGTNVTLKKALGWPPILRGISILSTDVAKVRCYVQRKLDRGGHERDRNHMAYALLRRKFNMFQSAFVGKQTMTVHATWYGNAYAHIARRTDASLIPPGEDGGGLTILNPDPQKTFPVIHNGQMWYVTTVEMATPDGRAEIYRRIHPDDIFHFRSWSLDGMSGVPVWDMVKSHLGIPIAAREFQANFFANGSNAAGVIMMPGNIKKDRQENVMKAWNAMASGLAKAHKVALIQDGAKYQQLTIDPDKAQLLETQKNEASLAALILGLPPHFLGDNSKAAYNSLESENRSYLERSLDGWFCSFETEAETKLLTEREQENETHNIEFNRKQLLSMSAQDRAESYKKFREMGVLSVNDILNSEGLPTIGPAGDVRHIPSNWMALTVNGESSANAHTDLIQGVWDRFAKIEVNHWRKTEEKGRGSDWNASVSAWYERHRERMMDGLQPVFRACLIAFGRHDVEPLGFTREIVNGYCGAVADALKAGRSVETVVAENVLPFSHKIVDFVKGLKNEN